MKRHILISSIIATLAALSLVPGAFATHTTPYNGSFSGTFKVTSQTTALLTSTGNEEHLGKIGFEGILTTTEGKVSCTGGFAFSEKDTTTAANGDKLFITANDVACPTSNPHVFQITGSDTINGGTGRFAHATGSATAHITAADTTATTGTFTGTFEGTISY